MKISSHQFLKAVVIGAGLFAVVLAYRANNKSAASNQNAFYVGNEPGIRVTSPLNTLPSVNALPSATSQSSRVNGGFERTEFSDTFASAPVEADVPDIPEFALEIRDIPGPEPVEEPQWVDVGSLEPPIDDLAFEDPQVESRIETEIDVTQRPVTVDYVQTLPRTAPKLGDVSVPLNDAAALKAVHHIEYGKSLARRSATEAAGQEFLSALRVLAESNDMAVGGNSHTNALRSGLLAMKEAAEFKVEDPQHQIVMNVAHIIDGHDTQVISRDEARVMTASTATRRYLEYAGHQLGACGGKNVVAAEALYCLGKMRTVSAQSDPDPESKELYEAIVFHHASLNSNAANHRSSNELGVLLARTGQLAAAETYLKNSLKLKQTPQGWSNLAKVHQRKGTPEDQHLANLAMTEYQNTLYQQSPEVISPIQLVGPDEFMARSPAQHADPAQFATNPSSVVAPVSNFEDDNNPTLVERISSLISPKESYR